MKFSFGFDPKRIKSCFRGFLRTRENSPIIGDKTLAGKLIDQITKEGRSILDSLSEECEKLKKDDKTSLYWVAILFYCCPVSLLVAISFAFLQHGILLISGCYWLVWKVPRNGIKRFIRFVRRRNPAN